MKVLSYHEGKDNITKEAQNFCSTVKKKGTESKIMNVENLSKLLKGSDPIQTI